MLFRSPGGELESHLNNVELIQLNKTGRWDIIRFISFLRKAIRRFNPDAVYSFLGTPNIFTALLKPTIRPAKIIWGVRTSDMDMTGYSSAVKAAYWAESCLARFADLVIANSEAGRNSFCAKGVSQQLLEVVHNGIDTDNFFPDRSRGESLRKEWGCQSGDTLIGLVARIDPLKDHETFLQAAALVIARASTVRFVCVGGGNAEEMNRLAILTERLNLSDHLVWANWQDDMNGVYNALDICCLSSITEGFPNVLGEAMSCNIPCVATNVGDAAAIIGDTGIIVDKKSPDALANALLDTISQGKPIGDMTPRLRIEGNFSLDAMAMRTEQLLTQLMSK